MHVFSKIGSLSTFLFLSSCGFLNLSSKVVPSNDPIVMSGPRGANSANFTEFKVSGSCPRGIKSITINTEPPLAMSCLNSEFSGLIDLSSYPDGLIQFTLTAEGGASNEVSIVKDTIAPSSPTAVDDGAYFNSLISTPTISYTEASDSGSGTVTHQIRVLSGANVLTEWTNHTPSAGLVGVSLVDGDTYHVEVRAVDQTGNTSTSAVSDGWTVDVTPPSQALSFKDMNFGSTTESPLMSWVASTDLSSGLAGYQIALGSTPGATDVLNWNNVGSSTQGNLTGLNLSNGNIYYPSLRSFDFAGNASIISSNDGFRAVDKWKNQEPSVPAYVNSTVQAVAIQADGKRILGGSFTAAGGAIAGRAVRLNANGSVDSGFNIGSGFNANVNAHAIQTDGKYVFVGSFATINGVSAKNIVRLNPDGSLDSSFSSGTGINFGAISTVAVQSDGRILIGGTFTAFNGTPANRIARLNTDGSIDSTFSIGLGFSGGVEKIKLDANGKILVGGSFDTYDGTSSKKFIRLNQDGSIDYSFPVGFGNTVYDFAIQSDGKIVVVGFFTTALGGSRMRIARLNSDLTLDPLTFGTGLDNTAKAVAIQSDGKIVVGGAFSTYLGNTAYRIVRINPDDGFADPTFTTGNGFSAEVKSLSIQSDGKIIAGGIFKEYNNTSSNYIARLNSDGAIDSSFLVGEGFNTNVQSVSYLSNGKIIASGLFSYYGGSLANRILRVNADGTIDSSFDSGAGFNGPVFAVAAQSDGKILVGGNFSFPTANLTRLNTDGSVDPGFPSQGLDGQVNSLAIQNDGKILIGGAFSVVQLNVRPGIARLSADGTLDTSFSIGTGFDMYYGVDDYDNTDDTVHSIAQQSDGKILVGGRFTSFNSNSSPYIVRLNTDGSYDSSFTVGGGFDSDVKSIAIQPDGKALIVGDFSTYQGTSQFSLCRLNSNGSIDTSLNQGTGINSYAYTVSLQTDGKILLGGNFAIYNGFTANKLVRLNTDGSFDSSFNIGSGIVGTVNDIAIDANGKILLGLNGGSLYDGNLVGGSIFLGW